MFIFICVYIYIIYLYYINIYGGNRYKTVILMESIFLLVEKIHYKSGFQMQMCLNMFVPFILPELASEHIGAHA